MRCYILLACLCVSSNTASAVPAYYNLIGTVTQVGPNTIDPPAIGQHISIEIIVQQDFPNVADTPNLYFTPNGNLIFSAKFNFQEFPGLIQTITIGLPNFISFHTVSPQLASGFDLALSGGLGKTPFSPSLPFTLDASLFTSGTFMVTQFFTPTSYGFSGTIDGLGTIPEPTSLAVLAIGLIGAGYARSRSKA